MFTEYNLYPISDEDVEMLYEAVGVSPEELQEMREAEQEITPTNE